MNIAPTIVARLILAVMVAVVAVGSPRVEALERILLVRHAEKLDDWPRDRELDPLWPLSEAGVRRAENMAKVLGASGIAAVYASPTTRSVQTGLPLAVLKQVEITVDPRTTEPSRMEALIADLRRRHSEDAAILIVGHSNTIPELLVRLGATPECYDALGIEDNAKYLLIEGYEGIWSVDLSKQSCDAIEHHQQSVSPDADPQ